MGVGLPLDQDSNGSSFTVSLKPNHSSLNQYSGFLQDEVSLVRQAACAYVGSKFEHNKFTGFEWNHVRFRGYSQ